MQHEPLRRLPVRPKKLQAVDFSLAHTQTATGARYIDLDDLELIPALDGRCFASLPDSPDFED